MDHDLVWKVKMKVSRTVVSDSLWFHGLQPVPLLCPWNFPGKSPGVGCHFLLQGIFPTRGRTQVSCVVGRFFTSLATKETHDFVCYAMLSHFSRVRLCVTPSTAATRLPRPWDSPGKNTGVGCHFLLQCMKVKSESEVAQSCPTPSDPPDCSPPGSSIHGTF